MILAEFKQYVLRWWAAFLIGFIFGMAVNQFYAYDSLIKDCKVLSMFRIAKTAFSCQIK